MYLWRAEMLMFAVHGFRTYEGNRWTVGERWQDMQEMQEIHAKAFQRRRKEVCLIPTVVETERRSPAPCGLPLRLRSHTSVVCRPNCFS